jgi:pSer/pThr/pTyr-binding forkhead associated (FHA) protein
MPSLRLELSGVEREPDGRIVDLTGEKVLVGRSRDCRLRILTDGISRQHCVLAMVDGRWIAQDLDSSNGTFLNGQRVASGELREGDELRLGEKGPRFRVVALDPPGRDIDDTRFMRPHRSP